jgi:hypothetical protein
VQASASRTGCVAQHLGRIGRVIDDGARPGLDIVAEHHRHLVRVRGAAEVAKLGRPVRRITGLLWQPRGLGEPDREQRRAQLGLKRLSERVVLSQCQDRDELARRQRIHARTSPAQPKIRSSPDA